MSSQSFIQSVLNGALKAQEKYGICASLTIAQAVLESGWGKYSPGNNMFGIKWTQGCGYNSQELLTTEYVSGKAVNVYAPFRVYNSLDDSLMDHAYFLVLNNRYVNLIGVYDYKKACQLIREDGYATDPGYTNLLIEIIEENKLYQYDKQEAKKKVENLVVYGNEVDRRAAEYLSDALVCPTINGDKPFDYSTVNNVYCVGAAGTLAFTAMAKKIIAGNDRYDTCRKVLDFIAVGCK